MSTPATAPTPATKPDAAARIAAAFLPAVAAWRTKQGRPLGRLDAAAVADVLRPILAKEFPTGPGGLPAAENFALVARVSALFKRHAETLWSRGELRAWAANKAVVAQTTESDWETLSRWFAFPRTDEAVKFRRTDLAALLNNWHAEIAKAERTLGELRLTTNAPARVGKNLK
jgi:hypothetical protein